MSLRGTSSSLSAMSAAPARRALRSGRQMLDDLVFIALTATFMVLVGIVPPQHWAHLV